MRARMLSGDSRSAVLCTDGDSMHRAAATAPPQADALFRGMTANDLSNLQNSDYNTYEGIVKVRP